MGRNRKNGLTFFPFDVDFFQDIKIRKLIRHQGSISISVLISEVFKRDNYTCKYCGRKGGILEVDHIIPFSKGGSNDLINLATSCRRCNRQKKDKDINEFLKWKKEHER